MFSERESQAAVDHDVFGMKPRSSVRAANAVNHGAMSPTPGVLGFALECRRVTELASGQLRYGRGDEIKEIVWVVL